MISKEDYLRSVKDIDEFLTEDIELYDKSNGIINTDNYHALWDMVFGYISLLETLTSDYEGGSFEGGYLGTYLFDRDSKLDTMGTLDDFYDNYIDKEKTFADKIRGFSDKQLADFLFSVYKTGMVSGKVVEKTRLTPKDMLDIIAVSDDKYTD